MENIKIVIYGTGGVANYFMRKVNDNVSIIAFIDSCKNGYMIENNTECRGNMEMNNSLI